MFRKGPRVITCNRFVARSALVALVSYVAIILTCSHAEAAHLLRVGAQSVEAAVAALETPSGSGEELCEFMHEQLFTKQAFSAGSTTRLNISSVALISQQRFHHIADLTGFRPPGNRFASVKTLSLRLHSTLRI